MNLSSMKPQNPLGVIALFITMLYGFANLLLGASVEKLLIWERVLFCLFVTSFPFVVLRVFYLLVVNHHVKLYAPNDFKDDSSFLKALDPAEVLNKLADELEETATTHKSEEESDTLAGEDEKTMPVNMIPAGIRRMLEVENYIIASKSEFSGPDTFRKVGIAGTNASFDAVNSNVNEIHLIEVKMVGIVLAHGVLRKFVNDVLSASRVFKHKRVFATLVLAHNMPEARMHLAKRKWEELLQESDIDVDIKLMLEFKKVKDIPLMYS